VPDKDGKERKQDTSGGRGDIPFGIFLCNNRLAINNLGEGRNQRSLHDEKTKIQKKTKKTNKKKPFFPLISSHEHTSKQQETSSTPVHAATPATPDRTTPSLP